MSHGYAMFRPEVGLLEIVEWMDEAACRKELLLFSATMVVRPVRQRSRREVEALRVCETCPVLDECRPWSLTRDVAGVAGGLTEWERRKLRPKGLGAA